MKTNTPTKAFDMISRDLTRNEDLTDSGYRLMVMLLNNKSDWKINLTFYQKILKWSNGKLSRTTKHLINLGYISREKKSKGNQGFEYTYQINKECLTPTKKEVVRPTELLSEGVTTNEVEKVQQATSNDVRDELPTKPSTMDMIFDDRGILLPEYKNI